MLSRTASANRYPDRSSERGNVAFSMIVLMVLSLVGVALLARSQNELKTTAATSAGARAIQAADVGITEAIAMIEAGATGPLAGSVSTLGGIVTYEAEPLAPGRYQIEAAATVDGTSRTIVATISGAPVFSEVLFLTGPTKINSAKISIDGDIGTNSELVLTGPRRGSRSLSGVQRLYGPDASCRGCPTPVLVSEPREFSEFDTPSRVQPCPADGRFSAVVDGLAGVPFDCAGAEVMFEGTVIVANGPVVVRVADGTGLTFNGADVNPRGALEDLRIEVVGSTGGVRIEASSVRGLVVAPGRRVSATAAMFSGALVAADLEVSGRDRLQIDGGKEVAELVYQDWQVVTWRTDP